MAKPASVKWDGLDELRAELRSMPDGMAAEGDQIVLSSAESAASEIRAAYPVRTGRLRKGVQVRRSAAGRFGSGAIVQNVNPIAFIFENGTQARHTELGADRGSMPPGHVFIPRVIKWRRRMNERLKALGEKWGFTVTSDV